MKLVIVNGAARSGKDSFVDSCIDILNDSDKAFGAKYSTVDFIKDVAKYCGWNGRKDLKGRKFLSDLKDLLAEWNDIPFKKVTESAAKIKNQEIAANKQGTLFVFSREPEEITRIKEKYNAITVCVRRDEAENAETSNHADANVLDFEYDYYIINNKDLVFLDFMAETFVKEILLK